MKSKWNANKVYIVDILLKLNEELHVNKSGKYEWGKHSSVKFNQNKWYRFSEKKGGLSVDFLTYFYNYTEKEAIDFLYDNFDVDAIDDKLYIPKKNNDNKIVRKYLIYDRFIDEEILDYFINEGTLYESYKYHSCIFVGKENDETKHVIIRSSNDGGNVTKKNLGDFEYTFRHIGTSNKLFVFEGPIDLLSYITLNKEDWKSNSYVSLCGLSFKAINKIVDNYDEIICCLDNDYYGQKAVAELIELYKEKVTVIIPKYKDFNEDIKYKNNLSVIRGIKEDFKVMYEDGLRIINKQSLTEKDKHYKELFEVVSYFLYNIDSKNKTSKAKAIASLLEVSKICFFLVMQQYRNLGEKYTVKEISEMLCVDDKFAGIADDKKYFKIASHIKKIKETVYYKKIYNEEDKRKLIKDYMSLANVCLHTHVFLIIRGEI